MLIILYLFWGKLYIKYNYINFSKIIVCHFVVLFYGITLAFPLKVIYYKVKMCTEINLCTQKHTFLGSLGSVSPQISSLSFYTRVDSGKGRGRESTPGKIPKYISGVDYGPHLGIYPLHPQSTPPCD